MDKTKAMSPLAKLYLGLALGFTIMYIICACIDLQTTEINMGASTSSGGVPVPDLLLIVQPIQLLFGWLPGTMVAPALVAWGIFLLVQGATFGFERAILHMQAHNKKLAAVFGTLCILVFFYDMWTNWNAHLVHGTQQQEWGFIGVIAAGVTVFPMLMLLFFKMAHEN